MSTMRFMLFACVCAAVMLCVGAVAETDLDVEETVAESAPVEEAFAEPEPAPLIAGMTVDAMLKAVGAPARETYRGTVSDVITGSMIIIARNGSAMKARVYGVDTPEPGQPYHQEARQYALNKFANETVNVSVVAIDSQNNPVVLVFNTRGESLSHLLAAEGLAWWDRRNAAQDGLIRRLNAEAITNEKGLYADLAALAPWDYRDSRGISQFTYVVGEQVELQPQAMVAPPSAEEAPDEPVALSGRGTMTQSLPRPSVPVPTTRGGEVDVMGLMGRHQPNIVMDDAGQPLGVTASDISQIPYAAEFGFRDGDIISNVNGIPVRDISEIMMMAPQFQGVKQFQVEVIRNGQRTTIPINLP